MALQNFVTFAIFVALLPNSVIFVNFLTEFNRGHIPEMSRVLFSALISKYLLVIMGRRAEAGNPWEMQINEIHFEDLQGGSGGVEVASHPPLGQPT